MIDSENTSTWPEYLTVPEVAGILRVSKMTVYRMIHRGDVTAVRAGRSFRVEARSLREYLSVPPPAALLAS